MKPPVVLGVRHHSPACARLVERTLERVRPAVVLIEGPADFNPRLAELHLAHRPPVALYSFMRRGTERTAAWTCYCDYSPEWVALQVAHRLGCETRFMDLPGWAVAGPEDGCGDGGAGDCGACRDLAELGDDADAGCEDGGEVGTVRDGPAAGPERQSPPTSRQLDWCRRLGYDHPDSLWDALFEQPGAELEEALPRYFEELRRDCPPGDADLRREEFMAACLAWAAARPQGVVAVCGGYHQAALEAGWRENPARWPDLPALPPDAVTGNYLIPFNFQRLDPSSGIPAPEYYQQLWERGAASAGAVMLGRAAEGLRRRRHPVSTADLSAARSLAGGLARLRGHRAALRTDLLDGLAGALVKTALEGEHPWCGPSSRSGEPLLDEIMAAFRGDRRGALAPDTPAPPLPACVRNALEQSGLTPSRPPRRVELSLHEPGQRLASQLLHRLQLLKIPGFTRESGPQQATRGELVESWLLEDVLDAEVALIEASAFGPDPLSAATAAIEEALAAAQGADELAGLLVLSFFAGLEGLSAEVLARVAAAVAAESEMPRLDAALRGLFEVWQHDTLLGGQASPRLEPVLEAGFARGLWLFEGLDGPERPPDMAVLGCVATLRDLHKLATRLDLARELAAGVMSRRMVSALAPRDCRGAALGYLWSLGLGPGPEEAAGLLTGVNPPEAVGDLLVGLFWLAREQVLNSETVVASLDGLLTSFTREEFLRALPALRLAFSRFPPRERERLGQLALRLRGGSPDTEMVRLAVPPEVTLRGLAVDRELGELLRRYGLA